jgi:hypothetical protein
VIEGAIPSDAGRRTQGVIAPRVAPAQTHAIGATHSPLSPDRGTTAAKETTMSERMSETRDEGPRAGREAFSTALFTGANLLVFLILAASVLVAAWAYSQGA